MKAQLRRCFRILAVAFLFVGFLASACAGGLEQIRPISKLPELDLRKLEQGDIVGNRGPLGSFARGIYAESCYFIHAPVATVGEKLLHWNSAKHPNSKSQYCANIGGLPLPTFGIPSRSVRRGAKIAG